MTVAGVAAALLLVPSLSGAAPLTPTQTFTAEGFFRFCAEAQLDIANIDPTKLVENGGAFSVRGTIYRTTEDELTATSDFVLSKSAVNTAAQAILVTQWTKYRDAAFTEPELIRCKLRTGESLAKGPWPPGSPNNGGRFAVEPVFGFGASGVGLSTDPLNDAPCSTVNQRTIANVWANLSPAQQQSAPFNPTGLATAGAAANTLTVVPDDVTFIGPDWTPPVEAYRVNGATLEVPSRSLIAPSLSSGNSRLEGAHYCTFIAPELLRDILLSQVTP
jgi:hypothetical protein